ncbi:MAG: L,D-transpeptidase family protein [Hyphomicrobiales bacterium]|nr:L,D-transpeptidase family protein [Hyphomicrobiales bacterium]
MHNRRHLQPLLVAFATVLLPAWALALEPAAATEPQRLTPGAPATQSAQVIVDEAQAALPQHGNPMYGPQTLEHTRAALAFYEELSASGGWAMLPPQIAGLKAGSRGGLVEQLKIRLILTGDLDPDAALGDSFNKAAEDALKRFQVRHGLSQTGSVGRLTMRALNVPVDVRLNQLRASIHRLEGNAFAFSSRYVVVNIPGAQVEAIDNGVVERRHVAIVGRPDRPSPVLATRITAVNLNPNWTVPTSIVKADILPHMRKDPGFLAKHHMRVIGAGNQEIDPATIKWATLQNPNFFVRQDPGPLNSLGQLRIDMPNRDAVFMHDTPKKELFRNDVRFNSSGCARIDGVRDLASWLLKGTEWEDRSRIDAAIASNERKDIKLTKPVPVAWVYLTGWAAGDGLIHFRDDIYGLDTPEGLVTSTISPRKPSPARADVRPAMAPQPPARPVTPVAYR